MRGNTGTATSKVCINLEVLPQPHDVRADRSRSAGEAEWARTALFRRLGGDSAFDSVDVRFVEAPSDAVGQEAASGRLHVIVKSKDERVAGRAFSAAAVELALANYPGFFVTSPPTEAQQFGVYWPALVPNDELQPVVVLADGRRVPVPWPPADPDAMRATSPRERPLIMAEPVGPTKGEPLGAHFGARSGDKAATPTSRVGDVTRRYAWLRDNLADAMRLIPRSASSAPVSSGTSCRTARCHFVSSAPRRGRRLELLVRRPGKGLGEYLRSRPW